MSLQDIFERLTQVSGRAVSANQVFKSTPPTKPANLPAVWVRWFDTVPTSSTHDNKTLVGRNQKRGKKRVPLFDVTALVSVTGTPATDADRARVVADEYMDALDDDNQLKGNEAEGVVAMTTIRTIGPTTEEWDNVVYTGIVARVECIEL